METIKAKLKELLDMNAIEPVFGNRGGQDPLDFDNIMERQEELLDELKTLARAEKTLLGREVKFQMADSHAVYVVTKVNKNTVQLSWVRYCDAWQDDRLGEQGNINTAYVQKQVNFSDWWENQAKAKTNV